MNQPRRALKSRSFLRLPLALRQRALSRPFNLDGGGHWRSENATLVRVHLSDTLIDFSDCIIRMDRDERFDRCIGRRGGLGTAEGDEGEINYAFKLSW